MVSIESTDVPSRPNGSFMSPPASPEDSAQGPSVFSSGIASALAALAMKTASSVPRPGYQSTPLSPDASPVLTSDARKSTDGRLEVMAASYSLPALNDIIDKASPHLSSVLASPQCTPYMLPTCISGLPSGEEVGTFLSVDLGGSTLRVAFVRLRGRSHPADILYKSILPVPDSIKQGTGAAFFLWMAHEIELAVKALKLGDTKLQMPIKMGLSWSFPFKQMSVDSAVIEKMGKGYVVADEITGWDLKASFEDAFTKLGIDVKVAAIVNDGSACMVSRAYSDASTRISLILGTGINAGIMLPATAIAPAKLQIDTTKANLCMVNTEISMLGDGIIPESVWDVELDSQMEHPGFQPLETKVSGRYLGEISRLIIRDLINQKQLFDGDFPKGLDIPYGLESATMSEIEKHYRDKRMDLVRQVFDDSHPLAGGAGDDDLRQICNVFTTVSNRSAGYTAAVVVTLADMLKKATESVSPLPVTLDDRFECTIAYTGTVIERYPLFLERCQQYLDTLGPSRGLKLRLKSSEDGSLLGPVIAAAMNRV